MSMTRAQPCSESGPSIGRMRPSLTGRMAAAAHRGWRTYWEGRARRATVLLLHSLDHRTLRDIGINPSEIESCVHGKAGDRMRSYNEGWPWRSRK